MKSPFDIICEIFLEGVQKQREDTKFFFEYSDKFMMWIVGFSIATITIIATNITQFNEIFKDCIKTILFLLIISIISGIVYRIFFFLFFIQYKKVETFLEISFSNKKFMNLKSTDLTNETDIKIVVKRLKDDFDEDVSSEFNIYESLNDKGKELLLQSFKDHYSKLTKWVENSFESGLNYAKDTYINAFGLSDKRKEKIFSESNNTFLLKLYQWLATIFWLASLGAFIAVLIILCVNF